MPRCEAHTRISRKDLCPCTGFTAPPSLARRSSRLQDNRGTKRFGVADGRNGLQVVDSIGSNIFWKSVTGDSRGGNPAHGSNQLIDFKEFRSDLMRAIPDFRIFRGGARHDGSGLPGGARSRPPRPADRADGGVEGAVDGIGTGRLATQRLRTPASQWTFGAQLPPRVWHMRLTSRFSRPAMEQLGQVRNGNA